MLKLATPVAKMNISSHNYPNKLRNYVGGKGHAAQLPNLRFKAPLPHSPLTVSPIHYVTPEAFPDQRATVPNSPPDSTYDFCRQKRDSRPKSNDDRIPANNPSTPQTVSCGATRSAPPTPRSLTSHQNRSHIFQLPIWPKTLGRHGRHVTHAKTSRFSFLSPKHRSATKSPATKVTRQGDAMSNSPTRPSRPKITGTVGNHGRQAKPSNLSPPITHNLAHCPLPTDS